MAELLSHSSPEPELPQQTRLECRRATTPDDLDTHFAIRGAIFVDEQALFTHNDRDTVDNRATVEHVVGYVNGKAAGTVRLYPLSANDTSLVRPQEHPTDAAVWKGDRLAVYPDERNSGIAGSLIRHAVTRAGELGGDRMIALIQVQNVPIFRHLGWIEDGPPALYMGQAHQQMSIGLQ